MVTTLMTVWLLAALSAASALDLAPLHAERMVCHMTFEDSNFTVPDDEPALSKCTHLVYNYIYINGDSYQVYSKNPTRDFGELGIKRMVAFKRKFPYLKTMIGVGGPKDNTIDYSRMAAKPANREMFVDSVVKFVLDHGLDGMDFDWRSPGKFGDDRLTFVQLVKELRQQFDQHYLILSLTLTGTVTETFRGVEPRGLGEYAHFLNLRTFNYKQDVYRNQFFYHNSPIFSTDNLDIEYSLLLYVESGVPAEKMNLGMSSECTNYVLLDANLTGDIVGKPTRDTTPISYYDFCKLREEGGWVEEWDNSSLTPYSRKGDQVVSHENVRSVSLKVTRAITSLMGGIAYYGLEKDDYRGDCVGSGGKYPMLRNIDTSVVEIWADMYKILFENLQYNARFWWNDRHEGNDN